MISRSDALLIAKARLATWEYSVEDDSLILLENETEETSYAWVIYWTSKRWHETQDFAYALAGGGPFIVSKQTGQITQYSGAYSTEAALEKYEEEEMLYGLRMTNGLTSTNRLVLKKLLHLSNQELLQIVRAPSTIVAQGGQARLEKLRLQLFEHGVTTEVVTCFSA